MRPGRSRGGFFEEEPLFPREPPRPPITLRFGPRVIWPLLVGGLILFLLLVLGPLINLYTDALWFDRLGYGSIFATRVSAQVTSFIVFGAGFLLFAAINVLPALGFRARRRLLTYMGIRQRVLTTPMAAAALGAVVALAFVFGQIGASQWATTLNFLNQVSFGRSDPVWHADLGFYVFSLPFFRFLWAWLLGTLLVVAAAVMTLYLSRTSFQSLTLSRAALGHVSILGALFFLLLAVHYLLSLAEIVLGRRGAVWGAGFADVNARVPGYWLMVALMLGLAGLLVYNLVLREQWPLAAAAGLWVAAVVLVTLLFPAAVQRFLVQPSELARERPYLQREIAATSEAYGLDKIQVIPFTVDQQVTANLVNEHRQSIDNARLWDPRYLATTYNQLQALRPYYEFNDVAVDRYVVNGELRQLELSARELNPRKGPINPTWVNLRLKFTHGYGAVASPVNISQGGLPELLLRDLPPAGVLKVERPGIYFGRSSKSDYVVVGSKEPEIDYPAEPDVETHWTGKTGVRLSGFLRRLAFALRLGDMNLLYSPLITSDSQILFRRPIAERARAIAPFLQLDSDPYLVVADGRLYWILDAYTKSDGYPYSERIDLTDRAGNVSSLNYLRNSVKIVVDAYDGSTTFYRIDTSDPVAATYARVFPGLLKPIETMPAALRPHLRYPQDLFLIQAEKNRFYHMKDSQTFYNREDLWDVAKEHINPTTAARIDPYYVILRLPGETRSEFLLMLPYTPNNRQNMIAYMAARSDGENYGKLVTFRYSKDQLIYGPEQVEASINVDAVIKPQVALLNQGGTSVILGNLLVLPIGRSLLFVEPLYTQSEASKFPQLKKVIVADGTRAVMQDTLDKAVEVLVGAARPGPTPTPGPAGGPPPAVATLIQQANQHYQRAQELLRQGDLAGYQREIDEVGAILKQLQAQGPTPSPSATPTPSPTRR